MIVSLTRQVSLDIVGIGQKCVTTYEPQIDVIMKKDIVTVIYDRKKTSARCGTGKVETCIYLSRNERKYFTLAEATPEEWEQYVREDKFADIRKYYEDILIAMEIHDKDMTIACFNECTGI